ncbi:MAG: PadR family transcriptional regulator [Deltaproteobacteria bacterium]|nr:PadR family transcriptional regulator [Deltaproteobacteria bacterium]
MSVQLVILGLLSEQPRHGYELRQEVERRLYATYINLSGGSLYYNLRQLEQAGYVEKARAERKGRYPKRQVYQITSTGKAHLGDEVRRLFADTESREKVFDPLNTALAFGHFVDHDAIRDALTRQLHWAQERAAWIRGQQEFWRTQEISLSHAKIIEHGLAHYQAEIGWLETFLKDLTATPSVDQPPQPVLKRASRLHVSKDMSAAHS